MNKRTVFSTAFKSFNGLVFSGIPFRDAYREVGASIENDLFNPVKEISHTHEGSIGNLLLDRIVAKMDQTIDSFNFNKATAAINRLLEP